MNVPEHTLNGLMSTTCCYVGRHPVGDLTLDRSSDILWPLRRGCSEGAVTPKYANKTGEGEPVAKFPVRLFFVFWVESLPLLQTERARSSSGFFLRTEELRRIRRSQECSVAYAHETTTCCYVGRHPIGDLIPDSGPGSVFFLPPVASPSKRASRLARQKPVTERPTRLS